MNYNIFPLEVTRIVLSHLDVQEQFASTLVCREWNEIAESDFIWVIRYCKRWPKLSHDSVYNRVKSKKKLYQNHSNNKNNNNIENINNNNNNNNHLKNKTTFDDFFTTKTIDLSLLNKKPPPGINSWKELYKLRLYIERKAFGGLKTNFPINSNIQNNTNNNNNNNNNTNNNTNNSKTLKTKENSVYSAYRPINLPESYSNYNKWGLTLYLKAFDLAGIEVDQYFLIAAEEYESAHILESNNADVLNNWGCALDMRSRAQRDETLSSQLFDICIDKFYAALVIEPNKRESLFSLGNALLLQSKKRNGSKALDLCNDAIAKYKEVSEMYHDYYDAVIAWGRALRYKSSLMEGKDRRVLHELAVEKYEEALNIKRDYEALMELGITYTDRAMIKDSDTAFQEQSCDEQVDRLLQKAYEKYDEALTLKDDFHLYNNYGITLIRHADMRNGPGSDQLRSKAVEKYELALKYRRDIVVYDNLACVLLEQANFRSDETEAQELFDKAKRQYKLALELQPNDPSILLRLGLLYCNRAKRYARKKYLEQCGLPDRKRSAEIQVDHKASETLFVYGYNLFRDSLQIKPRYAKAYNYWGIALKDHAKRADDEDRANRLFEEGRQKLQQAIDYKKDGYHHPFINMGINYMEQAKRQLGSRLLSIRSTADIEPKIMHLFLESECWLKKPEAKNVLVHFKLACLYSLLRCETQCYYWLSQFRKSAFVTRRQIQNERDLDPVRHREWFTTHMKPSFCRQNNRNDNSNQVGDDDNEETCDQVEDDERRLNQSTSTDAIETTQME